jgi:hypothetical protein
MYIIYCLQNESLKSNILSFGITSSLEDLKQLVKDINKNKTFLPTPYTVFLTKRMNNTNSIDKLYSLLGKFGKHIKDTFFEIPIEIVKQLFELIDDNKYSVNTNNTKNNENNEKYIVVQDKIEYSIPNVESEDSEVYEEVIYTKVNKNPIQSKLSKPPIPPKSSNTVISSISVMIDELDTHYDRLRPRQDSNNSNNSNNSLNENNNYNVHNDHSDLDL